MRGTGHKPWSGVNLPPPALHYIYVFKPHNLIGMFIYFIYYHTEHKINLHFNSFVFQNDVYQFKYVHEFNSS